MFTSTASSLRCESKADHLLTHTQPITKFSSNRMADNSRNAKLGSKEDESVFSWKLFSGWDFMIGHSETAANRIASVVMGFKEALLEEAEKQKDKKK